MIDPPPPSRPVMPALFWATRRASSVSLVSLKPPRASRDAPMTPSPPLPGILAVGGGTCSGASNKHRRHRRTAKPSVNRDTHTRARASPDPSPDESVSTRLVLPNLLAVRQTAAWLVGMWGGVKKKGKKGKENEGCGLPPALISGKCASYFEGACTVIKLPCRRCGFGRILLRASTFFKGRSACQDAQRIV